MLSNELIENKTVFVNSQTITIIKSFVFMIILAILMIFALSSNLSNEVASNTMLRYKIVKCQSPYRSRGRSGASTRYFAERCPSGWAEIH